MDPVNLFSLASQQSRWLSVRQAAVAGNIANANTPGYGAADVQPFQAILDGRRVALNATQQGHFGSDAQAASYTASQQGTGASLLEGTTPVQVEEELMKAGEIRRSFELNTAIVRSFNRMILMTTKA